MKRRGVVIFFVFVWVFIVIGGRLAQISLGESYLSAANRQSLYTLTVDAPRGTVFDRNLAPITNGEQVYKVALTATPQVISLVHARLSGKEKENVLQLLSQRKPFILQTDTVFSASGAHSFAARVSHPTVQPAVHLVGYLNEAGTDGVCGLQKTYNSLLQSRYQTTITYACDAAGGALAGVEPQITDYAATYEKGVITTLDLAIQRTVESAFPEGLKGAVVVQKAGSGEILASYSAPSYSPSEPDAAMEDPNLPLINRAFTAYNVGSVFKLCVAAAALEQGISPTRTYTCTGSIESSLTFACHKQEGHGEIDMHQALAGSCNTYFIDLARTVGGQAVYDMAVALGFGKSISLCEDLVSEEGSLPLLEELLRSPAELANFAIGQGVFMATPLQVSAAVNTIVNGGVYFEPCLVSGTISGDDQRRDLPINRGKSVISTQTASTLLAMMQGVMTTGTGRAGASPTVSSAGKTATAQTGMVDEEGNPITQAWFTGCFPAENPQYVVTVLVEGGTSGGVDAAPIFKTICEGIWTK